MPDRMRPDPPDYWVEPFCAKFKHLRKLVLVGCGFRKEDVQNLIDWVDVDLIVGFE